MDWCVSGGVASRRQRDFSSSIFGDGESSFLLLRSLVWRNGDEAGKKAGPGIKAGLRWNVEGQGLGFHVRATACRGKCSRVLDVMPERVSHVTTA